MTPNEIEREIQARIEFKMNEFLTAVKNRVALKYNQAFDMTRESECAWKSFKEVSDMLNKEINMPTPVDDMVKKAKWEAKEKAVAKIIKSLRLIGMEYNQKIKSIVSAVELAQEY